MANCENIDELTLRLLRLMDELLKSKVGMEAAMSDGFINMAKARMLMGKERVSMLQVPTTSEEDIIARYTVRRESSGEDVSLVEHKFKTSLILDSTEGEVVDDYLSKSENAPQLRQRKSEKKRSGAETVEDNTLTAGCDDNQCMMLKKNDVDPMKWFGVLVPRELKLAQKSFEEAISLSVDCANLQLKIETVREALKTAKVET